MGLGQGSEQVGQDNVREQPGKAMRSVRMQLPLRVCGLSVSVLLVAEGRLPECDHLVELLAVYHNRPYPELAGFGHVAR